MKQKYIERYPGKEYKGIIEQFKALYHWLDDADPDTLIGWGIALGGALIELPFAVVIATLSGTINKIREIRSRHIKEECTYVDGKLEGVAKSYWPNGRLKELHTYRAGQLEGLTQTYYENGNLESSVTYRDGKKEGIDETYYENGNLKSSCPVKDDLAHGVWREYYERGQLKTECILKNGEYDGLLVSYHENGQVQSEILFKNGLMDGPAKEYNESGKLIKTIVYRNDSELKGQEAEEYLEELERQKLEENPKWIEIKDRLDHLTDDVYYPEIKPAKTPERTEKAKKLLRVRRGAELLAGAMKDAKKSKDETLLGALKKLAHPFAKEEAIQRRSFSRIRMLRKIRRRQK